MAPSRILLGQLQRDLGPFGQAVRLVAHGVQVLQVDLDDVVARLLEEVAQLVARQVRVPLFQADDGRVGLVRVYVVAPHLGRTARHGNHVVASHHPRPWRQQLNVLAAYVYFYSPLRFLAALVRPKTRIPLADAEPRPAWTGRDGRPWHTPLGRRIARKVGVAIADACVQLSGMFGLVYTVPNVLHWCVQLRRGRIERYGEAPTSVIPMRAPDGTRASHALPGTPVLSV